MLIKRRTLENCLRTGNQSIINGLLVLFSVQPQNIYISQVQGLIGWLLLLLLVLFLCGFCYQSRHSPIYAEKPSWDECGVDLINRFAHNSDPLEMLPRLPRTMMLLLLLLAVLLNICCPMFNINCQSITFVPSLVRGQDRTEQSSVYCRIRIFCLFTIVGDCFRWLLFN